MPLPKNPTAEDYQRYYDTLAPEQQKQFRKAGLLNIINQFYKDKAEDLTEDAQPEQGSITSGTFIDRRPGGKDRVFRFKLTESGGEYDLEYLPTDRRALMEEASAS